ncbi:cytochrome-c oxidase [Psychrobacillus sp. NPDC096426]|uniref:cytochrome-c oxidase n=1 Tax=Psychrobacillus sp. NPDC096426 TaxID=3364491 RepID=UPI0037F13378
MAIRFIKISVVYFVIGVPLGLYMSMAHDYALKGVHVHVNLIEWTSFALAGFVYRLFPSTSRNMYARLHFWIANIGLPLMMIALTVLILNGARSGNCVYCNWWSVRSMYSLTYGQQISLVE